MATRVKLKQLSQESATTGQGIVWNGSLWAPGAIGDISNGGNTTGAVITIGTNDAFGLNFKTNNIVRLGITGGASTGGLVTISNTTLSNATVDNVLTIKNNNVSSVLAGFGAGILFQGRSSSSLDRNLGYINSSWTVVTDGTRTSKVTIGGVNSTVDQDLASFTAGATPVLRIGTATTSYSNAGIFTGENYLIGNSAFNLSLSTGGTLLMTSSANSASAVTIAATNNVAASTGGINIGNSTSFTAQTSGTRDYVKIAVGTAFTSGSAVMNLLSFTGTINNTGTTGIGRTLYFNNTITAHPDYRIIEIASNNANTHSIYQSGPLSKNYFAGKASFGTSTISDTVRIDGTFKLDLGSDATGDIYYRNSSGLMTRLGVGTNGDVLTLGGGLPTWAASASDGNGIYGGSGTVPIIDGPVQATLANFDSWFEFRYGSTNTALRITNDSVDPTNNTVSIYGNDPSNYINVNDYGISIGSGTLGGIVVNPTFIQTNYSSGSSAINLSHGSGSITVADETGTFDMSATSTGLVFTGIGSMTLGNDGLQVLAKAEFQESLLLGGTVTPPQITSDVNDYAPSGIEYAIIVRLDTDSPWNITGIANGQHGRTLILENVGLNTISLPGESASSAAINRFDYPGILTLQPKSNVIIIYDGTITRWKLIAQVGASGVGGIYGGSGNIPDTTQAKLTSNGTFDFIYSDDNIGVRVDDNNSLVYISSKDTDSSISVANSGISISSSAAISLQSIATNVSISGGTSAGELIFYEPSGSGTNYTGFRAQAMAGDVVYTLPAASGQVLTWNASDILTWESASGGGIYGGSGTIPAGTTATISASSSFSFKYDNTVSAVDINDMLGGIIFKDSSSASVFSLDSAHIQLSSPYVSIAAGTSQAELRLLEASGGGSNYTGFKTQAMSVNTVYTLPAAGGTAGQFLTWNASDILTWSTVPSATTSVQGIVELATTIETTNGTDTTRAITPRGLSASLYGVKQFSIPVGDPSTVVTTGDGKAAIRIDGYIGGMDLIDVGACVKTASSSGTVDIQIRRVRAGTPVDMLSTPITIDANEVDSSTAATPWVINTSNDDTALADQIYIDVDSAGTAAVGLIITLVFQTP
jgi:hypothetical protein